MKPASAVTWGLLWVLTASSIVVGCFGLCVSLKATSRASYYQAQCVALMQENQGLKDRLASMLSDGQQWEGQIGTDRFGHAIFKDGAYSVRAAALVLRSYERKHGIKTVRGLVTRFAEGNQKEYVAHLCRELKVKPDEEFSFMSRLPELLRCIIKFETGMHLGEEHLALVAALR